MVQAISKGCATCKTELAKNIKMRKITAVITIDVRNAFNTLPWHCIMEELERRSLAIFTQNCRQLSK